MVVFNNESRTFQSFSNTILKAEIVQNVIGEEVEEE